MVDTVQAGWYCYQGLTDWLPSLFVSLCEWAQTKWVILPLIHTIHRMQERDWYRPSNAQNRHPKSIYYHHK